MIYKNRKGFTLVEMLTTITILGIVTLVALPTIRTLKTSYNNGKYDMYKNSLESAAKLFVDSYSKDLFGNQENGCVDLVFKSGEKFFESGLIEDIEIKDVTCENSKTLVRVRKNGQKYEYYSSVICKEDKADGKVLYENTKEIDNDASCDNDASSSNIVIKVTGSDQVKKTHTAQIELQDAQGFSGRQELTYEWFNTTESLSWKEVNNKKVLTSKTINSPSGKTGAFTLKITSYNVKNKLGNFTVDKEKSTLEKTFTFDNTKPTVNLKMTTKDPNNKTNTGSANVIVDAYDQYKVKEVCISTTNDSKKCNWINVDLKESVQYKTSYGNENNVGKGTKYILYAFARDVAGNIGASSKVEYEVTKDDTPPRVSLTATSQKSNHNTAVANLKAVAVDDFSNITEICILNRNDIKSCRWSKNPNKTKTYTYNTTDGDVEMIGTGLVYNFYAFAKDEQGNIGTAHTTYKVYTNCTSTTHIDCRGYREVAGRPCTVPHGNGWGKKGAICNIKDDITQAKCGETLRTCPCDSWCDRDGKTNIPWNEFDPSTRKYWDRFGGTCKTPFCSGGVLCAANACMDANYY